MWCDDFDMDLLKVFPETPELIGDLALVKLHVNGHVGKDGTLNHPSVWNGHHAMEAYFGFYDPGVPHGYITNEPVVDCTFLEALRDCWPHHYAMIISGVIVWNSFDLDREFMTLMYDLRGWLKKKPQEIARCRENVIDSLKGARAIMKRLAEEAHVAVPSCSS